MSVFQIQPGEVEQATKQMEEVRAKQFIFNLSAPLALAFSMLGHVRLTGHAEVCFVSGLEV